MTYAQLPQLIDPIAIDIGGFEVRWYGLMWIVAFVCVWAVLSLWVRNNDVGRLKNITRNDVEDIITVALVGALIGGRIGYVLFYASDFFIKHPVAIIWPFANGEFVGISGLSFHGGVVGVAMAIWLWARKKKWSLYALTDFIVPAVPLGYMFGRIGNFLNHELWGRETITKIGMYFQDAPDGGTILRHPSQLYEAFFEGVILFLVLWVARKKYQSYPGALTGMFLVGYAVMRTGVEFFREPDPQIGFVFGIMTMGQVLSVTMFLWGAFIIIRAFYKK